jgi:hypothetical protein
MLTVSDIGTSGAVPLTTSERMSRQMTVLRIANGLTSEHGDGWPDMTALDVATAVVDLLVDDATVMPSERWDEDCHRCEKRIGDHLVDGRCPPGETIVVTHWRAVDHTGGIAFSLSTRDDGSRSRERVEQFCAEHPQYHLETWEQVFQVTPSEWSQVNGRD